MSLKEVDLRDALDPLAGDPVADAARVLAALPQPGIPPVAWWLLGVGVAAGLVLGMSVSDDPIEPQGKFVENIDPTDDPDRGKTRQPDPPNPESEEMGKILFFGLGMVSVTEPGQATVPLDMEYLLELGTRFETGEHSLAGTLLDEDIQVRMGKRTIAMAG